MGVRFRELLLLLAVCALSQSEPVNKTAKGATPIIYQYDDFENGDEQEVLFNEDRPCPRDCKCTVNQGYKIANCNRLEIGVQKFGDDITDLVIENAEPDMSIQLTDHIFKKLGLHQISTVKIVNSTIDFVSSTAFNGLPELYAVNLSNNKLKNLHPETFATNKKLLLLTLANNPLAFPQTGYFLNATTVQEMDLSYCNMKTINVNTFRNMPGLMYLNIAGNNLTDLDPDTFKKLLDLEELDLSDNNIKSLPDNIFTENNELATLHIQRNPVDTVYGLQISDLLTLNAGQTNIKFVGPSMFNGMTYIANLNLSGNSIQQIHNQAFHKLVELNYLDLSYNNLTFISSVLIKENIELDIFKISNNPMLRYLPVEGFNCSAEQFNIYLFEAANCGLEEIYDNSLKTFTALSVINLSVNNIKSISSKVFSVCPKLVEINLANNMLNSLDGKIFENNNELDKLYLQGNPIKILSAEVFIHTPMLTRLDISNAELTTLWKTTKNNPELLGNLTFLNVSQNHIIEIKQSEVESLNRLRSLDISYNPLVCNREFENLMTWLSKRKVSPNAVITHIANMATDAKEEEGNYNSWESLTRKTCGSATIHPVDPLRTVSDEEIWERIDEDAVGNFDLKNTLDDGKLSDDTMVDSKKVISNTADVESDDDKEDDDDDKEDETDDEADDEDDEDDDDASEDYDDGDDDPELKVKLVEKQVVKAKLPTTTPGKENVKIAIKLLENDSIYEDLEPGVYVQATLKEDNGHGRYDYLWPILIAIFSALLLLIVIAKFVMVVCSRRHRQVKYNSAIIAAMSQPGRTKKDCGLVYQQLSEDLTGPTTPKLSRYQPLPSVTVKASNMSYESSPFHHSNIVPEAV